MENFIIGGTVTIAPIILFLLKIFAEEYMTNLIKQIFKSKTKKKADFTLNIIIVLLLVLGFVIIIIPYIAKENTTTVIKQKSDTELALETGKFIYEEGKEYLGNRKECRDSIRANKEKRFVYQIGDIKDNEESIANLYFELMKESSIDSLKTFVFKISKNKYFLYQDCGYSEVQIKDSLENFKLQINNLWSVKIVNLMDNCKLKEKIIETKALKYKKNRIQCCKCDK